MKLGKIRERRKEYFTDKCISYQPLASMHFTSNLFSLSSSSSTLGLNFFFFKLIPPEIFVFRKKYIKIMVIQ